MEKPAFRIVVLVSGFGSNLQAILDTMAQGLIPAHCAAVISDKADAYALTRAAHANIPAITLLREDFPDKDAFNQALIEQIDAFAPDLVVLSGYMRILSTALVDHFHGRILNIHPSLLPKYPGLDTYNKVLCSEDEEHGTTVHFVNDELDNGPIIAKMAVPIEVDDDEKSLKARVQDKEHILYPTVVQWFAQGRVTLKGSTVYLDDMAIPADGLVLED